MNYTRITAASFVALTLVACSGDSSKTDSTALKNDSALAANLALASKDSGKITLGDTANSSTTKAPPVVTKTGGSKTTPTKTTPKTSTTPTKTATTLDGSLPLPKIVWVSRGPAPAQEACRSCSRLDSLAFFDVWPVPLFPAVMDGLSSPMDLVCV